MNEVTKPMKPFFTLMLILACSLAGCAPQQPGRLTAKGILRATPDGVQGQGRQEIVRSTHDYCDRGIYDSRSVGCDNSGTKAILGRSSRECKKDRRNHRGLFDLRQRSVALFEGGKHGVRRRQGCLAEFSRRSRYPTSQFVHMVRSVT